MKEALRGSNRGERILNPNSSETLILKIIVLQFKNACKGMFAGGNVMTTEIFALNVNSTYSTHKDKTKLEIALEFLNSVKVCARIVEIIFLDLFLIS